MMVRQIIHIHLLHCFRYQNLSATRGESVVGCRQLVRFTFILGLAVHPSGDVQLALIALHSKAYLTLLYSYVGIREHPLAINMTKLSGMIRY